MSTPVFSIENINRQNLRCRRNKRNTINSLRFEYQLEENLWQLPDELRRRTYVPSRSVCFVVNKPKLREIFAADFRDRVVHHVLVDVLERVFEPRFIYDSYACRRGKGNHRAVDRLQNFIRRASTNNSRPAAYLQLDIRVGGFYEFYDKHARHAMALIGLNAQKARPGFKARCGFPTALKPAYLSKLLAAKKVIWVVDELGSMPCGLKDRKITEAWMPASLCGQ